MIGYFYLQIFSLLMWCVSFTKLGGHENPQGLGENEIQVNYAAA